MCVTSLLLLICCLPGQSQQNPSSSNWISDKGYAEVRPGGYTEGGTLDVKAPAPNLSYCTHKLCIDRQSGPVRYYPIMWTAKEWKVKYFADPANMKPPWVRDNDKEDGKTAFLGVTLYVKFVPDPTTDPECSGSLLDAKELKAVPLGQSCFVYRKAR